MNRESEVWGSGLRSAVCGVGWFFSMIVPSMRLIFSPRSEILRFRPGWTASGLHSGWQAQIRTMYRRIREICIAGFCHTPDHDTNHAHVILPVPVGSKRTWTKVNGRASKDLLVLGINSLITFLFKRRFPAHWMFSTLLDYSKAEKTFTTNHESWLLYKLIKIILIYC